MRLSLVFWETTKSCNLECSHCRASATSSRAPEELTTVEAKAFIKNLSTFSKPVLVFSGGEPLIREDIFELCRYTYDAGLKPAIATNATLISYNVAKRLKASGVDIIAVSVYGSNARVHDGFCGESGAFEKTIKGIENAQKAGIKFQLNTTITKKNLQELKNLADFCIQRDACAYHVFFLVPTGRGKYLNGDRISPDEYETAFNDIYDMQMKLSLSIKVTCAPHYYRVMAQRNVKRNVSIVNPAQGRQSGKGCLAGTGVCFVSHNGGIFGCGYLTIEAGNLRKQNFKEIWFESELLNILRDEAKLVGKCGFCEFKSVCGGCRARAYAATNNYLEEEPECLYQPLNVKY